MTGRDNVATGLEKQCSRCKNALPKSEFYLDSRSKDGLRSDCRSCVAESVKRYRENNPEKVRQQNAAYRANLPKSKRRENVARYMRNNRDKLTEKNRQWRKDNPEIALAHSRVFHALRKGEIIRPSSCERCGGSGRIEASHTDYSKPLDIEWLCVRCHRIKDKNPFFLAGTCAAEPD